MTIKEEVSFLKRLSDWHRLKNRQPSLQPYSKAILGVELKYYVSAAPHVFLRRGAMASIYGVTSPNRIIVTRTTIPGLIRLAPVFFRVQHDNGNLFELVSATEITEKNLHKVLMLHSGKLVDGTSYSNYELKSGPEPGQRLMLVAESCIDSCRLLINW